MKEYDVKLTYVLIRGVVAKVTFFLSLPTASLEITFMFERAVYLFSTMRMISNVAFKAGSSKQGKAFKLGQL